MAAFECFDFWLKRSVKGENVVETNLCPMLNHCRVIGADTLKQGLENKVVHTGNNAETEKSGNAQFSCFLEEAEKNAQNNPENAVITKVSDENHNLVHYVAPKLFNHCVD